MLDRPCIQDIFPREILFSGRQDALANALLPWARRNPRFTLMCALELAGCQIPEDLVKHRYLAARMEGAIRQLGCQIDGTTELGARIWKLPADAQALPILEPVKGVIGAGANTSVAAVGFSDVGGKAPQQAQVEMCRAWLREHARPIADICYKFTSDSLRRLVTAWSATLPPQEQVNEHTGERYASDKFYVSNGAFITAALAEGYHARRVRRSCDAWFNMGHHQTGARWRGKAPKPWREPKVREPKVPEVRVDHEAPVVRFLARMKGKCFRLAKAPQVPNLRGLLRKLGCLHKVMRKDGGRGSWWFRAAEFPSYWAYDVKPLKRIPVSELELGKWLQGKTTITLAEAAQAVGLTHVRGRAPSRLIAALTAAGFVHKGRLWKKLTSSVPNP